MATCLVLALTSSAALAHAPSLADDTHTRCGWFDNPSPSNATLADHDGEWTVAVQGGPSAEGAWPKFKLAQWVRTGVGAAGYGCACLKVREDPAGGLITHIVEARANDLSVCQRDDELTVPVNPLK